jgi:hypothetical protein
MSFRMKTLFQGIGVLAIFSALFGCGREVRYSVNHEAGFFVIARHERHLVAITETQKTMTGYEVTTSGQDGIFSLNVPRAGLLSGQPASRLVLSKPGFVVYIGYPKGPNSVGVTDIEVDGRILLKATESYRDERLALFLFEREATAACKEMPAEACEKVQDHLEARQQWIRQEYPDEVVRDEAEVAKEVFRIRVKSWKEGRPSGSKLLAAAALPDDRLVVVAFDGSIRRLHFLGVDGEEQTSVSLADGAEWAALDRAEAMIAIHDAGAVKTFDHAGAPMEPTMLEPPPAEGERVKSLSVTGEGFLLGIQPGAGPPRVRFHARSGELIHEREVPGVQQLSRVFLLPDGVVLIHGKLDGTFDYDLVVAGMKKTDAMPRGVVRLADWTAEPEVLVTGIDAVTATEGGLLGYSRDLYAPEDHQAVLLGMNSLLHQVLLGVSMEGAVENSWDVTDERIDLTELLLDRPLDHRLVLYADHAAWNTKADIVELDLAAMQSPE